MTIERESTAVLERSDEKDQTKRNTSENTDKFRRVQTRAKHPKKSDETRLHNHQTQEEERSDETA